MADYKKLCDEIKKAYDIKVHRWRKSMSGCSWRVYYFDGRTINWIEAPPPRTQVSLAVFLHEVGHHVIGFTRYKLRYEEEYHAWVWAIAKMRKLGIRPDKKVVRRVRASMKYAVSKASRRGLKTIPARLRRFGVSKPVRHFPSSLTIR